ncbi:D-alanine--D-alanine ligase [soil metagenome]
MITILKGGTSAERQVSLWTAASVAEALTTLNKPFQEVDAADADWLQQVITQKPEVVIIALHGPFGEDGQVQAALEEREIAYTGTASAASKVTMNKAETKRLITEKTSILTAKSLSFIKGDEVTWSDTYPVVVKPNGDGSSFGVTIVQNAETLTEAVGEAFKYGNEILLETFIKGTELTCGVIDVGDGLQVLPLVEIRPTESFFNFEAKYTASKCEEICPAEVSQEITEQIQDSSLEAFLVLGCRHYARADWILGEDGKPYFLEINTLPGMTKTSLIPQELAAAGISYTDFIDQLVVAAR